MIKNNKIIFDIMINGMWYATERLPFDKKYIVGENTKEPIYNDDLIMDWVEKRRPTLKRGKYKLCF